LKFSIRSGKGYNTPVLPLEATAVCNGEMGMTKTVMIEEAELQKLIKWVDDLQRAMNEFFEHAEDPDEVEGRCARIQLRLGRMRELLTVVRY
jgi:hypothetical protein